MRYLFGPTSPAFADEYLAEPRRDGACLCLGADVPLLPGDTWADVAERLPPGWRPDRLDHVRVADLSGLGRSALDPPAPAAERDVDVLVVDDLHPAARRERLNWVGRLAQLADECRVVVRRPATPAEDREWLTRARVVVQ